MTDTMPEVRPVPPFQDMATLAANLCASSTTVDTWVKQGILPPPRRRGGKLYWYWPEVERALSGNVYFVESGDFIKIGYSTSPRSRIRALQRSSGHPMRTLLIIHGTEDFEKKLHGKFFLLRSHGEWFRKEPRLLKYIEELKECGIT